MPCCSSRAARSSDESELIVRVSANTNVSSGQVNGTASARVYGRHRIEAVDTVVERSLASPERSTIVYHFVSGRYREERLFRLIRGSRTRARALGAHGSMLEGGRMYFLSRMKVLNLLTAKNLERVSYGALHEEETVADLTDTHCCSFWTQRRSQ